MEELTIKVTKKTADALRKVAREARIPIGEVVDRYALNVAPDDPENAVLLVLEHCTKIKQKRLCTGFWGDVRHIFWFHPAGGIG